MQKIIVRRREPGTREESARLDVVQPGSVVRFAEVPFDTAMKENGFFIVCGPIGDDKTGKRIRLCSLNGSVTEKDPDRLVVEHDCIIEISPKP